MGLLLLLINVAGAVALLLWSVRMVRTGFERAKGNELRAAVRRSANGRFKAALMGTGIAMLLQSSTAVAVLATGFAATGVLSVAQGIALLLGADLGSAIVAKILSFNVQELVPIFLIVGGLLFFKGHTGYVRQIGRIFLGIGMILISLQHLGHATTPLQHSAFLIDVMFYLNTDIITSLLIGVLVTWLLHSSVASVLLIATLVGQSVVPFSAAIAYVLGANIGSGLIAYTLTREQPAISRRIPIANLMFRLLVASVVLFSFNVYPVSVPSSTSTAATWVMYFHVGFNTLLLITCLPLTGIIEKITERLIPDKSSLNEGADTLDQPNTALDRTIVHSPQLALASASRECLRMGDVVNVMLTPVMNLYEAPNEVASNRIRDLELQVNRMHSDIKLYVAELDDEKLSEPDKSKKLALINFAVNLESAGDIIVKNLLPLAESKHKECLTFSTQGWGELTELHTQVTDNMHLSFNTLISNNLTFARRLIEEKDRIRILEQQSNEHHYQRLHSGSAASVETSDIHLETIRALRQINSLFAAVAYPILSQSGDLLDSRLNKYGAS
ncbi:MAG: Na/Pi cotransporter family protein [Granulosicoccus sp.]